MKLHFFSICPQCQSVSLNYYTLHLLCALFGYSASLFISLASSWISQLFYSFILCLFSCSKLLSYIVISSPPHCICKFKLALRKEVKISASLWICHLMSSVFHRRTDGVTQVAATRYKRTSCFNLMQNPDTAVNSACKTKTDNTKSE